MAGNTDGRKAERSRVVRPFIDNILGGDERRLIVERRSVWYLWLVTSDGMHFMLTLEANPSTQLQ